MKKSLFVIGLLLSLSGSAQLEMDLYEGAVPNSKQSPNIEKSEVRPDGMFIIEGVQKPTITSYIPANPNGASVIICPGGGYRILASRHEGEDVAKEFNKWGVTAFVLKYRLPDDKWMVDRSIGPLQDGQRAIQFVRKNAVKWKLDPSRIGIMGFSAGGHLASSIATHYNDLVIDNPEKISVRPDFQILIYPVISFTDSLTHMGSRNNLVGREVPGAVITRFSGEMNISNDAPPAFMVHAVDDRTVKVQNSLRYTDTLIKKNIPVEQHIYEKGGHGFGMNNKTTNDKWMERLRNWMISRGLIK